MTFIATAAELGSAIAAARKAQGLKQADLAKRADTTQAKVSHIENGKDTAQIGIVLRLVAAVGLTIELVPPGATGRSPAAANPTRADNVIFDEPLPDDSIDIDAIATGTKPRTEK